MNFQDNSIVFNNYDVPSCHYNFKSKVEIDLNATVDDIIYMIQRAAKSYGKLGLHGVILNSHGSPAYLAMGKGIGMTDLPKFQAIHEMVVKIVIVACQVAKGDIGRQFCLDLARYSGSYVVASAEYQHNDVIFSGFFEERCRLGYAENEIDDFEGTTYMFDRWGRVSLLE